MQNCFLLMCNISFRHQNRLITKLRKLINLLKYKKKKKKKKNLSEEKIDQFEGMCKTASMLEIIGEL